MNKVFRKEHLRLHYLANKTEQRGTLQKLWPHSIYANSRGHGDLGHDWQERKS